MPLFRFFMGDLTRQERSNTVGITGDDEQFIADVIEDDDQKKKLLAKVTISDGDVTVSNKLRILESQQNVAINAGSFSTIYTLSSPAVCSGFMLQANTADYTVRLRVDGDLIFEIDTDFLSEFANWNNSANPATWISFNSSQNIFYFVPALPLKVATNITIEARSNGGNRRITGYYIQVAEL